MFVLVVDEMCKEGVGELICLYDILLSLFEFISIFFILYVIILVIFFEVIVI